MYYLDRRLARKIAKREVEKEGDKIKRIVIQLQGDEFWNTETIWENGKRKVRRHFRCYEMSYWATPVVRIYYKDGREQVFPCYRTDEKFGRKIEKRMDEQFDKSVKMLKKLSAEATIPKPKVDNE